MSTATKPTAETAALQAALRGRFVWYDLMTSDVAAATAFYTKVAGWGTQDFDMGGGKYQMWTVGEAPIGGAMDLSQSPPGTPPHWISYVSVPDVDETIKQAESLGGRTLLPGTDIPTVGRFAIIADPQGAVISIFTSSNPTAPRDGMAPVGNFSWHELTTTDHRAAFEFYTQLFGWEKLSEMDMGEMGIYVLFGKTGQPPFGGMFNKPADMPMPPNWGYYIRVNSADESAELIKSLGGQVLNGPMEVPGGDRIAQCMDPQGTYFAVHSSNAT
jgi:predicted enzyme related to lactoylglutathione lyase